MRMATLHKTHAEESAVARERGQAASEVRALRHELMQQQISGLREENKALRDDLLMLNERLRASISN